MEELLIEAYDLFYLANSRLTSELKKAGIPEHLTQAFNDLIQLQALTNRSYYGKFKDMGALNTVMKKVQAFIDKTDNKSSNPP